MVTYALIRLRAGEPDALGTFKAVLWQGEKDHSLEANSELLLDTQRRLPESKPQLTVAGALPAPASSS